MTNTEKLNIVYVPIEDLIPSEYNPRKASDDDVRELKKSLKRFGFVDPVIVNSAPERKNVIIGGHFRCHIAKILGYTEAPVVYVNIPDIEKEKELNLRLNKNLADWDWELLTNINTELLTDVGFTTHELGKVFRLLEDDFDVSKELLQIDKPRTKKGDIYTLGQHRLLCGDATDKIDVEKLMGKDKARLIFTDPPWNVNYTDEFDRQIKGDKTSKAEFYTFLCKVLKNYYDYSTDDASLYWFFAGSQHETLNRDAIENTGWRISQLLIWIKDNIVFSPGIDYHRVFEPIYFGWKNKNKHFSNKGVSNLKSAFHLDKETFAEMLDLWYSKREEHSHPNQKPVRLAERALKKNSLKGDIVADFFGGSGTTLIACEQAERQCRMIELDETYCDLIVNRWQSFTNKKGEMI